MYLSQEQSQDKFLVCELATQALAKPITHIEPLRGGISYNWEVNHQYIFKLPSVRTHVNDWINQVVYMPILQNYLSYEIPQPCVKTVFSSNGIPFTSIFYPKIKGKCINSPLAFAEKTPKFKRLFFEQLSDAISQIHKISPSTLPLELPTKLEIFKEYFFKHFLKKKPTALEMKLFYKVAKSSSLGFGKSALKTSRLIHSDLHSGNVVLNNENKIVGLLDFDALGRGDYFAEFRPNLYARQQDIDLFREIYTTRTGHKINPKDIENVYHLYDSVGWLSTLFQLYDANDPKERKALKRDFQQLTSLFTSLQKMKD